jgi:hypothetical protein
MTTCWMSASKNETMWPGAIVCSYEGKKKVAKRLQEKNKKKGNKKVARHKFKKKVAKRLRDINIKKRLQKGCGKRIPKKGSKKVAD